MVKIDSEKLHNVLINYAKSLKIQVDKKELSANTIPKKFRAIKYVLNINGRENDVKWKIIEVLYPKPVKRTGYKPYTNEQVKQLISNTGSPRNIAVIHLMASTSCRLGIHDHSLRIKHLKKMSSVDGSNNFDCYAVLFYADADITFEEKDIRDQNKDHANTEEDEYFYYGFLTPEATLSLDKYFEYRKKRGEILNPDSPVFNSESKTNNKEGQLNGLGVRNMLYKLLNKSDIVRVKSGNRYDIQIAHGLRKRGNTIMKLEGGLNANIAEKLMAHKRGLDGIYLMPTREECFNEFKKAIPSLTLDKSTNISYKKCVDCYTLNNPKSKNCIKCNKALDFDSALNDMSKMDKENYNLRNTIDNYKRELDEYKKQKDEFRLMFDSLKKDLLNKK